MSDIEKAFELVAKNITSNRDILQLGVILGLLSIAFVFVASNPIPIAGVNLTTITNVITVSKINISQINALETWNATYINMTGIEGTLITAPTRNGVNNHSTSYISVGTENGNMAIGQSVDPLNLDPTEGTLPYNNATFCSVETRGKIGDSYVRTTCQDDANATFPYTGTNWTTFIQAKDKYIWQFGTYAERQSIRIESMAPPELSVIGQPDFGGGLNMGGNRIYNSPEITNMWSTGVISGGDITFNNSSGIIHIASGVAMIRIGLNSTDKLVSVVFDAKNFTIVYGETKYIYLDYVSSTISELKETAAITDILGSQQIQVYQVFLNDEFHYIDARKQNVDTGTKLRAMLYETDRFRHATGAMLSNPSDLNLSVTAGRFFYGLNPVDNGASNTATGNKVEYYYHNSTGVWFSYLAPRLNETHYNPTGSGLVALLPNKYKVEWVYLVLDSANNSEIAVLFGNTQYTALVDAEAETVPSVVPTEVRDISVLIGRVIIKEGVLTPQATESSFTSVFLPSGVYDHNALANLQGGNVAEYYHLNTTQYNNIISSILPTTKPSSPVLGSIFYNSTTHTTNCYDSGWRYCGNGTFV